MVNHPISIILKTYFTHALIIGRGIPELKKHVLSISLATFFFVLGIIILLEQYLNWGVWFQLEDIHHETFVLSSFALAIGILIGSNFFKK